MNLLGRCLCACGLVFKSRNLNQGNKPDVLKFNFSFQLFEFFIGWGVQFVFCYTVYAFREFSF